MFSYSRSIVQPSSCDHAILAKAIDPEKNHLVVAHSNILSVYALGVMEVDSGKGSNQHFFRRLHSVRLNGIITGLASASSSSTDYILLSFADAKLSVIQYSQESHTFETVSMHYYENDDLKLQHKVQLKPVVRVDPSSRCALLWFYRDYFAVLPFVTSSLELLDEMDEDIPVSPDGNGDGKSQGQPFLPSFVKSITDFDDKLRNVVDCVFLHGYFEPTLAVLLEPKVTSTNRLAQRKDTMTLVVISLALTRKAQSPIVLRVENLPYDCLYLTALDKPFGGVLVTGVSSISYYEQGARVFGFFVNGYFKSCSNFQLEDYSHLKISLEGSRCCMISDKEIMYILSNGHVWLLTLEKEGRMVRKFSFEKVWDFGCPAESVARVDLDKVFVGSNWGDSRLLQYSFSKILQRKQNGTLGKRSNQNHLETSSSKKAKKEEVDELDFLLETDVAQDSSQVVPHENGTTEGKVNTDEKIIVLSSLPSLSAISGFCLAESYLNFERFSNPLLSNIQSVDMILSCGYGKQTSFASLSRSIKPIVSYSFDLQHETVDCWSVDVAVRNSDGENDEKSYDKYLVLSKQTPVDFRGNVRSYTVVLTTGSEFLELEGSDFDTKSATVAVASMFDKQRIVQITPQRILLLDSEAKKTQSIDAIELRKAQNSHRSAHTRVVRNLFVVSAVISLHHLCVLFSDGSFMMFEADFKALELVHIDTSLSKESYKMISSVDFPIDAMNDMDIDRKDSNRDRKVKNSSKVPSKKPETSGRKSNNSFNNSIDTHHASISSSLTCVAMLSTNDELQIVNTDTQSIVFKYPGISSFPDVIVNQIKSEKEADGSVVVSDGKSIIKDISLVKLGLQGFEEYFLVLMTDFEDMYCYRMVQNHHDVLFVKVPATYICRSLDTSSEEKPGFHDDEHNENTEKLIHRKVFKTNIQIPNKLHSSSNIPGIFASCSRPCWIYLDSFNELQIVPMTIDGAVSCFTSFNNFGSDRGFLYFLRGSSVLRMAKFDQDVDYNFALPARRASYDFMNQQFAINEEMPKDDAVRHVQYLEYHHVAKKAIGFSYIEKDFDLVKMDPDEYIQLVNINDNLPQEEREYKQQQADIALKQLEENPPTVGPGQFYPKTRKYSVELYSPKTWEIIERMDLQENEHVLCVSPCTLDVKVSGSIVQKNYIAVGTGYVKGEDEQMRGRVILFDVIEVVPKPGRPETNHKLKQIKSEDLKGSCTQVCSLNGSLCVSIGPKLMLYSFEDGETMVGVAFFDGNCFATSMKSFKSYLLVGDIFKSIAFFGYQEDPSRITMLSRDYRWSTVLDINYIHHEKSLVIVISDKEGNLQMLSYNPTNIASRAGQKLLRVADFALTSEAVKLLRVPKKSIKNNLHGISNEKALNATSGNSILYACVDGTIGYVCPLEESEFKRLSDVCSEVINRTEHIGGLNARAFRLFRSYLGLDWAPKRNVIDGDVMNHFVSLKPNERSKRARFRGTDGNRIIQDLLEIEHSLDF